MVELCRGRELGSSTGKIANRRLTIMIGMGGNIGMGIRAMKMNEYRIPFPCTPPQYGTYLFINFI